MRVNEKMFEKRDSMGFGLSVGLQQSNERRLEIGGCRLADHGEAVASSVAAVAAAAAAERRRDAVEEDAREDRKRGGVLRQWLIAVGAMIAAYKNARRRAFAALYAIPNSKQKPFGWSCRHGTYPLRVDQTIARPRSRDKQRRPIGSFVSIAVAARVSPSNI